MDISIFEEYESEVRGYIRSFPTVFTKAIGSRIYSEDKAYIDFFSGAGGLNYGSNNPVVKQAMLEHINKDGLIHGLDMATDTKAAFIKAFQDKILKPRNLKYKMQFTGPTGANAVEAALKLARAVKKRHNIVAFTNAFHGVSLGPLAATANSWFRNAAGVELNNVTFVPYEGYINNLDSIEYLQKLLDDPASGLDKPAAVIVETVQAEGGIRVASKEWLQRLRKLTQDHDILLIVDDIQAGCGRAGSFFSFEESEITPDMVTLSKSISGSGLPMSLLLISPEIDIWKPGQHNGTFRGNNLAFASAKAVIDHFWSDDSLVKDIAAKSRVISDELKNLAKKYAKQIKEVRGKGMIWGAEFYDPDVAKSVAAEAFSQGLIIERSGPHDEVVKLMPALVIDQDTLKEGLDILHKSIDSVLN